MICILDYGSGNVRSLENVINYLGFDCVLSNDKKSIEKASHLILPGVGSFNFAIQKIKDRIPLKYLEREIIKHQKPFLGICVGMQVLFEKGFENQEIEGLGWIKGHVDKLQIKKNPLPHMGWNEINIVKKSELLMDINPLSSFYFLHSYVAFADKVDILTTTDYESNFCSSVSKKNIYGVQFHPEKSQKAGQKLLKNFCNLS